MGSSLRWDTKNRFVPVLFLGALFGICMGHCAEDTEPSSDFPLRKGQPRLRTTEGEAAPLLTEDPAYREITNLGGAIDQPLALGPGYIQITLLPGWKGGDKGLALLEKIERVDELMLDCPGIDDHAVQDLTGLSPLKALHLRRTHFSASAIRELAVVPKLHLLSLEGLNATDEALGAIEGFDLSWLIVGENPSVTDDGLKYVGSQQNLLSLRLAGSKITGATLGQLSCLDSLRELVLSGTSITDAGLAQLGGLKRLYALDLSNTDITGRTLAALGRLPSLRELLLDNTTVDDQAVRHLADLTTLEFLSLDGTRVTDEGLATLTHLKCLRYLSLSRTATTPGAIESIQRTSQLRVFRDDDQAPASESQKALR